ncbi:MAG: hypothetical protein WCH99_07665 [Verrucomicrobiota bacterium]
MQHFAHPAASLQHLAQAAGSLQQPPSHFIAGLVQAPSFLQHDVEEQPVVIRKPAAKTAASIIIFFMVFIFGCLRICTY